MFRGTGLMQAVVGAAGAARVERVPVPQRPVGWVRLRVLLAGICRTDVQAATGLLPLGFRRILGHELVGEVIEADDAGTYAVGTRVAVVSPLIDCGDCQECAAGVRCAHALMLGVDVDGGFAEQVVVPVASVRAVPDELPLRRAAYIEPIAATTAVLRAPIRPEQRGVVVGSGRIADLTLRVLRAHGFLGLAPDGPADFVVETSGTAEGLGRAVQLVRPGGVVVLKSRPAGPVPLDIARAVRNDVTLAAVSYGSFDEAVRWAGELDIDDLLGQVYPLSRFADALAEYHRVPMGPKLFLDPNEAS
ncbi:alcohol dehydrogenase catalytic domain-containing protein [Nocardia sp. NPDC050406]|uniref:alcohol dehydrogenase catalytic domain-containing protein n=1 Tax=Nocardia sp. NPDC050406 TaxID=3364318 RepID=UPI00379085BF